MIKKLLILVIGFCLALVLNGCGGNEVVENNGGENCGENGTAIVMFPGQPLPTTIEFSSGHLGRIYEVTIEEVIFRELTEREKQSQSFAQFIREDRDHIAAIIYTSRRIHCNSFGDAPSRGENAPGGGLAFAVVLGDAIQFSRGSLRRPFSEEFIPEFYNDPERHEKYYWKDVFVIPVSREAAESRYTQIRYIPDRNADPVHFNIH